VCNRTRFSEGQAGSTSTKYDVDAKAGGPTTSEQLALMLRELLTDRFRLSLHGRPGNSACTT